MPTRLILFMALRNSEPVSLAFFERDGHITVNGLRLFIKLLKEV